MKHEPKLGLVTVLYNGIEVLEGFFKSLSVQTFCNYTLYVIDNSPDDKALDEAKALAEQYQVNTTFINNHDNLGVAKANNQGIEASLKDGCDYVLLLNNDIEFDKDTITEMLDYTVQHDENIIVPKIYYYGTNKIWMAGGYISKLRGTSPHRGDGEEDKGQYDKSDYIGYAPTCFMLINKAVFEKVGLMDEKYFVYYDDTDFVYRANQVGFRIAYFPKATVGHKVSFSTGGSESLFSIYYLSRNRIYFINKNFQFPFKQVSKLFFFLSRPLKMIGYNRKQLRKLFKGVRDGLDM